MESEASWKGEKVMKKYIATFQRVTGEQEKLEHDIYASSQKHAKKLAKETMNKKWPIGRVKLVDVRKAE